MSFSPKVKEDVLVACRRRCVLCGKFCGLKIELHHIKPHAQGGENTFENCIPLCFDHHAEVGQGYNTQHPKGTKYTENELKRIRNEFYKQILDGKIANNISQSLAINYEKSMDILRFLYNCCLVKNELGVIKGYNSKLHGYSYLKADVFKCEMSTELYNELLTELEQQHFISTELRRDGNGILSGTVKINIEGIKFYEDETMR